MSLGRTKSAFTNMIMSFLNQFISLLLNFISRTIFIRVLGIELLGVNGLFSDILGLLSIADLGFNTAMVYSFYKPIADGDDKKISALINFYKNIYRKIAISVAIIGLMFLPFLNTIVRTHNRIPLLEVYYLFALAGVVVSYLFIYKTSIITADQKNYVITKITMVINFIKTTIQIITLVVFKNYILYLTINLFANFINNYIASKKAVMLYPYINEKHELDSKDKKEIFENIKSIFLYKMSSLLLNATDNTLISILVGTITVGLYSNYLLIANNAILIVQLVFGSLTASIGNLVVKEKCEKRYQIFKATQSVSFIICGMIVISFSLLINDFIKVWLGEEFVFDNIVVLAVAINMYLTCILQPLWTYREATGLYIKTKYIMLLAAMLNLILSIVLGKVMGLAGILFSSAIARLTTYFWYEPLLLFKDYFAQPVRKYYGSICINVATMVITSIVLNEIFSDFIVKSWIDLILKAIICLISVSIVFVVTYFRSEGIKIILRKLNMTKINTSLLSYYKLK